MTVVLLGLRVLAAVDPLGPVDQDADEIRDAACRIVAADRVCAPPEIEPPDDSSADLGWLASLAELLFWVMFVALVAVLLWFVVRTLMTSGGGTRRRPQAKAGGDVDEVEELTPVAVDRTREPADWRREAEQHRVAGRFRDAIRCRYRALVGDLARRGLIDEIPGRTSGEERQQMSHVAPAEAPVFAAAAELFDQAWFGGAPVGDGDVAEIEHLEGRVLSSAGQQSR